ncbi:hypothetical protein ARNL5_01821 [Anaerolineae bacterium]|nr:hypothetical protein ARNL5_01821 [Anaerolineae bacterium]
MPFSSTSLPPFTPSHQPIDPSHGNAKLPRQIHGTLTGEVALHDFKVAVSFFGDQAACWFLGKRSILVKRHQDTLHDAEQGVT